MNNSNVKEEKIARDLYKILNGKRKVITTDVSLGDLLEKR